MGFGNWFKKGSNRREQAARAAAVRNASPWQGTVYGVGLSEYDLRQAINNSHSGPLTEAMVQTVHRKNIGEVWWNFLPSQYLVSNYSNTATGLRGHIPEAVKLEAQRKLNDLQMSLITAYHQQLAVNRQADSSIGAVTEDTTADDFFFKSILDTNKYSTITRQLTTGEVLVNARNAAELMSIAKIQQATGRSSREEGVKWTLQHQYAKDLFTSANAAQTLLGVSTPSSLTSAPVYQDWNKISTKINAALEKKYHSLGSFQYGTKDGEQVVYQDDASRAMSRELEKRRASYAFDIKRINEDFNRYSINQRETGTYQTAYLNEEQMLNAMLFDIESSYTLYNDKKSKNYMGDKYQNATVAEFSGSFDQIT